MVLETLMILCMTEQGILKKRFMLGVKIGQREAFLNLKKNLVINLHWSCSIMKIYIICYVPAQIPYLGKILFLRYRPKCSQPIRLQDFLINYFSRTNWSNSLIFCILIQIHKIEKLIENFLSGMVKNGCGQSGCGTLKLTVFQEWTDGINCFFTS